MPNIPSFLMGGHEPRPPLTSYRPGTKVLTPSQIADIIYPLTKDDEKCGFRKAKKLRARAELITAINDYKEGKQVELSEEVLKLLI